MPSKPNAKTKPPRLVLFDTIPELTIVTGSISEMINSPTKVKPQNSPNSPISNTFDGSGTTHNSSSSSSNNNDNNKTSKFSPTQPSPTSPIINRNTPSTSSTQKSPTPPTMPPMLSPPAPYPWLWSCHSCRSVYRLACTRRCLECGHVFCCLMPAINQKESEERDKNGKKRKRSGRGRKGGGPCIAEFDYLGWSAWGSYRRSVTGAAARRALTVGGDDGGKKKLGSSGKRRLTSVSLSALPTPPSSFNSKETTTTSDSDSTQSAKEKEAAAARLQDFATWHLIPVSPLDSSPSPSSSSPLGSKSPRATTLAWHHVSERETRSIVRTKEKMYVERSHNCWSHCDYPSECRQTVIAACEEGHARIDRKTKKLVWVNDWEKDAIEARRRRERERERENMKKALGARRSRSGQEERGDVERERDGDSSSSSSTSFADDSSSSSSDASSSEDERLLVKEATIKSDWKEAMTATQGTQEGPEDDNTGNLTIATLESYSRLDGCSSRQGWYITVVADDKTVDPAKLLKNDPETIPVSPASPLAEGRLALEIANPDTYQSFASFIDFGPMEIDDVVMQT